MKVIVFICLIFILNVNHALAKGKTELSATELVQYCAEVNKGSVGSDFDKELALICKGYMSAFFDSMVVVENLSGEPPFCIPNSLPKTQNNLILKSWVSKNQAIAAKTTAAVALFAAFKTTFPCQ